MKLTNRAPNPNFEVSAAGVTFGACNSSLTTYAPMIATGSKALSVTVSASPTTSTYMSESVAATAGEWIGFGMNARYSSQSRYIKMRLIFRNEANVDLYTAHSPVYMLQGSSGGGNRFVHSGLAPAGTAKVLCLIYLFEGSAGTAAPLAGSVYSTDAWTIVGAPTQAEAIAGATTYFDGDSIDGGGLTYGWDGTPGLSSSYRVDSVDLVHDWSRAWWKTLPGAYRAADVAQGYPLLRYMEGAGRVAGEVRALSDDMWGETFMNPATTPDTALRWVAQLMGVPAKIRDQPTADLRAYLIDLALNGRPASGTRGDLANAARRYLTGAKQVSVVPSPTSPHRIVLLVRADEVPGADVNLTNALNTLVANVRSTGVMPAGHELAAQAANPTWDSWEAAAGATWDTREAAARTWTEADSLGVVITA